MGKLFRRLAGSRGGAEPWSLAWSPAATEQDILYCFRLLLGRVPHDEEWRGHSMRVGEDLAGVVASYLKSLEFARRGLLEPERLDDVALATLDGFRIYTALGDAAVGRYVREDNYERDVTAVFRRLLRPGMGVVDIGANIGYFTLLAASLVGPSGHVLAVEPNPRNARLLEASRRVNGFEQVTLCQTAAGTGTGLLVLHTSHSNGTTSTPPDELADLLGAETVPCLALDRLVSPQQRVDLIKVDVEGAEYTALRGCAGLIAAHRPAIISEFSPDLMPGVSGVEGETYLRWLMEQGYGLAVIQPDGTTHPADIPGVMREYQARGTDHLDLLATHIS